MAKRPMISKQTLIKLQKKLKTDVEIGKVYGISRQAIHQNRQKYGIKPIKNKNKERNGKIKSLYRSGNTGVKIAKIAGLSVSQVYRVIKGSSG